MCVCVWGGGGGGRSWHLNQLCDVLVLWQLCYWMVPKEGVVNDKSKTLRYSLKPFFNIWDFTAKSSKIRDSGISQKWDFETHHKCRSEISRLNEKFLRLAIFKVPFATPKRNLYHTTPFFHQKIQNDISCHSYWVQLKYSVKLLIRVWLLSSIPWKNCTHLSCNQLKVIQICCSNCRIYMAYTVTHKWWIVFMRFIVPVSCLK